jgi:hypothetical protein
MIEIIGARRSAQRLRSRDQGEDDRHQDQLEQKERTLAKGKLLDLLPLSRAKVRNVELSKRMFVCSTKQERNISDEGGQWTKDHSGPALKVWLSVVFAGGRPA